MLKAFFVSRCSANSLHETRRVLDAYALRVGDGTWQTAITDEGLGALRIALSKNARKSTAVACHVLHRGRMRLFWVVGSRRRFGADGAAPIRSSIHGHPALERTRRFLGLSMLLEAVRGAGMGHDLGKSTVFFQSKLHAAEAIADPVRHEGVSALLLPGVWDGKTITEAFDATTATLSTHTVRRWIESVSAADASGRNFPVALPLNPDWTMRNIIAWLIATHHRLPAPGPGITNHVNSVPKGDAKPWTLKQLQDNAKAKIDLLLPADSEFVGAVRDAVSGINQDSMPAELRDALFLWGRLALMLGDHLASSMELAPGTSGLIANSPPRPDSGGGRTQPQDLVQHLKAVTLHALRAAKRLVVLDDLLPSLDPEDCGSLMSATTNKRYRWQNQAANVAKALAADPEAQRRGAFVVMAAGTGSGKTRAAARVALTLAGGRPTRLSTLLGLRSLTLQTGDAYREQLGVPAISVAVLIGSREVRALHELAHNTNNDPEQTKTIPGDCVEIEVAVAGDGPADIPSAFHGECRRPDERKLLAAPVAICTIDYLMSGADWRRGSYLLAQLRIASSDLILDEVDGYDLTDYPAISRLCYLAGMFGRRLILSSATAMPELVSPLYEAFAAGRTAYAALSGNLPDVDVLLIADTIAPQTHHSVTSAAFPTAYGNFCASLAQKGREAAIAAPLRQGRIVDIRSRKDIEAEIAILHSDNATQLPGGVRLSVGLVRFARVRDAAWVAIGLARGRAGFAVADAVVKVLPYHSYLPLAVRQRTEQLLDGALQRNGPSERIAESVLCRAAVREARERRVNDIIIIVVATPVEEVGRDHDFDYGLIEPSSSRSIIQCGGRINRHRRLPLRPGQHNIVVMRFNCRSLEQAAAKRPRGVFHSPGFEPRSPDAAFADHDVANIAAATVALPTAEPCLGPLDEAVIGKLAYWERSIVQVRLKRLIGADFVSSVQGKITTAHMDSHRFRAGDAGGDALVFYDIEDECWRQIDPDTGKAVPRFKPWPRPSTDCWLLAPEDFAEINQTLMTKLDIEDSAHYARRYLTVNAPSYMTENQDDYWSDPMMGLFAKKESILA